MASDNLTAAYEVLGGVVKWMEYGGKVRRSLHPRLDVWYRVSQQGNDLDEQLISDHEAGVLLLRAMLEKADEMDINIIQSLSGDYRTYVAHRGPMVLCYGGWSDTRKPDTAFLRLFRSRFAALTASLKDHHA